MITVSGLTKSFGARTLLRDAHFFLGAGDRVALVGPNGSGKTTFLEILAGLQSPDEGRVEIVRGTQIGYLAQETDALRGRDVLGEVVSAHPAMQAAGHELASLEGASDEASLARFADLQDRFEVLGGYGVEAEARRVLSGLGFKEDGMVRPADELSGGWLMRVALAKLLVSAPDVLLLDEPTNHLDLESVVWLERFLGSYGGAVLLVSHDRDFMNGMATRVVEIDRAQLVSYTGNFEAFVQEREARAEKLASMAKNQAKRVAEVERFIERFRYKNTKARQVQSRIKMLDRMERVETVSTKRRAMKVGFPAPPRSGEVVAELSSLTFGYGASPVYEDLDLTVHRGDKIALVGPNGAGKTTLLKLLAGALQPWSGHRRLGHNVSCGYFAQHAIEALDPRNRVAEEIDHPRPRDILGRFLFSGDDVDKPISVLSGGERTRVAMAKLLCEPHNFLCLDEPTNHLDMESRDVLEDALSEYEGALVLITHDRHLIRSIANRIVEVVDGTVFSHPGDYESFAWHKAQQRSEEVEAAPARGRGASAKDRRREEAERRARLKVHRDALARVEAELDTLTVLVSDLEAKLADPELYADAGFVAEASREHGRARARVAELEAEWEKAAHALEEAETVS